MLKIKDQHIREITPHQYIHNVANELLQKNPIDALYIDQDAEDNFLIKAFLKHYYIQYTRVQITLDKNGNPQDYHCSEGYFIDEKVYILVTLMRINQLKPTSFPFRFQSEKYLFYLEEMQRQRLKDQNIQAKRSHHLIASYRQDASQEIYYNLPQDLQQIFTFLSEENRGLKLRFKVGTTSKYLIKSLRAFLADIAEEQFVAYGKKLAFTHTENCFDEASLKTLTFIRNFLASSSADDPIKELELTFADMDNFYDSYLQIPAAYRNFKLQDEPNPLTFEVEKLEEHYRLFFKLDKPLYLGKRHLYLYSDQLLTRILLDPRGKVVKLLKQFNRDQELFIHKEDLNDFYTYILSDIIDYINLVGIPFEAIQEEQLIVLYGDIDEEERICLSLEYYYENGMKKQGFDSENQSLSLKARRVEGYLQSHALIDEKQQLAFIHLDDKFADEFIKVGLIHLQSYCDIYVTESLRQLGTKSIFPMTVGVSIQNDLLAIDFDSVDIPKEELADVFDAYKRKKKFYKLKSGDRLYLNADALQEIDSMLDTYHISRQDIVNGRLELDLYHAFSMNELATSKSDALTYYRSELFSNVIARFQSIKNTSYPLAASYQAILRDYQKYGYQWLQTIGQYGFGGILADDMGLGKTLQIIALLDQTRSEQQTSIVICPASLILNWEDEVHKFSADLQCIGVYGAAKKRKQTIADYQSYDLLITSYDYLRRDLDDYQSIIFQHIVLDEAQYIKNPQTKNALAVKRLKSKHRLALTGTPIENSLAELWSIFDFLMPGYLYPYHHFKKQFELPIVKEKNEQQQLALKKLITPFILRRTKKEVLSELPEKIEQIIPVKFNDEECKLYLANLVKANEQLQEKLGMEQIHPLDILALLTRLRQICCEPRMLFENIPTPSSKLQSCIDLIQTLKENNKKILLFSTFTSVLDLLGTELEREGISYYILTGQTNKAERRRLVQKFQEDTTTVFLISLKAGGTGLNLTAAEAVIHFDPWWNMSAGNQATDRAHRIGQKKVVQVFKLIMKNSIEEKILALQEKKKNLADTFVEGNDGSITSMSTEEMVALFTT